jgi:uncharacterized protein YchJ
LTQCCSPYHIRAQEQQKEERLSRRRQKHMFRRPVGRDKRYMFSLQC